MLEPSAKLQYDRCTSDANEHSDHEQELFFGYERRHERVHGPNAIQQQVELEQSPARKSKRLKNRPTREELAEAEAEL